MLIANRQGASFCHYCQRKLVFARNKPFDLSTLHADPEIQTRIKKRIPELPRYSCKELKTPGDGYLVRVHNQCESKALEDGYTKP